MGESRKRQVAAILAHGILPAAAWQVTVRIISNLKIIIKIICLRDKDSSRKNLEKIVQAPCGTRLGSGRRRAGRMLEDSQAGARQDAGVVKAVKAMTTDT